MPPGDPRSRPNQHSPSGRGVNVRNEAFENIFGRPSVAHHVRPERSGSAQPPLPPPGPGYGYQPQPPPPTNGGPHVYLYPEQPSFPSGQRYAPPLPRTPATFPPQRVYQSSHAPQPGSEYAGRGSHDMNGGYGRATPQGSRSNSQHLAQVSYGVVGRMTRKPPVLTR